MAAMAAMLLRVLVVAFAIGSWREVAAKRVTWREAFADEISSLTSSSLAARSENVTHLYMSSFTAINATNA